MKSEYRSCLCSGVFFHLYFSSPSSLTLVFIGAQDEVMSLFKNLDLQINHSQVFESIPEKKMVVR